MNLQQLDELAEDDPDYLDDGEYDKFRNIRMREMMEYAAKKKFGKVREISKPDWDDEIVKAPKDVTVVIMLYQTWSVQATIMQKCLDIIAKKYPCTKFVKAVATNVIENFADTDIPALLFYKNGKLTGKIIPAAEVCGGDHMTAVTVEFVLSLNKILEPEEPFEEDPRDKLKLMNTTIVKKGAARKHFEEVDSEGEDDREYMNNQMYRYKRRWWLLKINFRFLIKINKKFH